MAQNFGFGRGRLPPGAQEIQNNPSYAVPVDREWSKLHDQIKRFRNYVKLRIEEIKNGGMARSKNEDLEDLECWLCAIDNPRDYCTSDLNSIYDRLQEDSRRHTIPGAFDQRDREEENPVIESTPEPGHGLVTDFGYIPPSFSVISSTSQFEDRGVENNSEQTNETGSQNCTSSSDKFRTNFNYKPELPKLLKVKPVKTSPSSSTDTALYHRSPEEILIQDDDSDTPVVYDYNHVMTDCNQVQEVLTQYKPRNNIQLHVGRDRQTPNPAPIRNQDATASHRRLSVESMDERASVNRHQPIPRSSYSEVGVKKARAHRQPSCESLFTRRMPDPSAPRNDRRQRSRDKLRSRSGSKDDRRTRSRSRSESSDKGTRNEGRFNPMRISHDERRSRSRSRGRKRRRNSRDDYRCFSRSKEINRRRDSRDKNRSRSRSRERSRRRDSREKNRSRSRSRNRLRDSREKNRSRSRTRERNRRRDSREKNRSRSRSRERNRRKDSRDEHRSRSRSRARSRSRESRSNESAKYNQRPRNRDESDGTDLQIQIGDRDKSKSTGSKGEDKRNEKQAVANPLVPLLAKEIATLLQRGLGLNTSIPTLTQPTFQQSVNSSCQSMPDQPGVGCQPRPMPPGEIPASFNGVYPNVPFNPPIPQYVQPPPQSYNSNNPQGQVFLGQNSSNIVYGTRPSVYVQQQRQRFPPHPTHGGNPYDFNNGISQAHLNQQHLFNGSFQNPRQNQVRMNNFHHNQAHPTNIRPGPIPPDRFSNSSRNQNSSIPFQPMPPPSATITSQNHVQGPQINHLPRIQMPVQVPRIVAPTYKDHRELNGIPSPRHPRQSNPRQYNNPRDPRKGPARRNPGGLSTPTPINSLPTTELNPEVQTRSTPTDKIIQPNIASPTSIINQIPEKSAVNRSVPSASQKIPGEPVLDLTDLLNRNKGKPRAIRTPASKKPVAECQPHEREQGRRVSTEEIASKSTTGSGLASKIRADSGITDPSPPIHTPSSLGVPRQNSGTSISAVSTVSSQQKTELDRRRQRMAEQCRNDPVPKQPSRLDKIMKTCIKAGIGVVNTRSSATKNPTVNKPNLNSESPIVTRQFAVKSSSKKRKIAANLALSQSNCPRPTSSNRPAQTQEATVTLPLEPQPTQNESSDDEEEVIGIQKRKKVLPLVESESENELEPETVPVKLIPENKRFCKDGFIAGDKNIKVLVHQLPEFYTTKTDFSYFRFFENQFRLICNARLKGTRRTSQTKKAYSEAELQRIRQEKSQQPYQNLRSRKKKTTQADSNLQTSKSTEIDGHEDSVPSISPNSEPPGPDVAPTPSNSKPNLADQEPVVPLSSSNSKQPGVEPNPSTSGLSREEFVQRFVSLRYPEVRVKEEKIDPDDQ